MKKETLGKFAAIVASGAMLSMLGFAMLAGDASAFGPGQEGGGDWFGPEVHLSDKQRQEIERIHDAGDPMTGRHNAERVLDSLGENPDTQAVAAAKAKIADGLYGVMKMHYQIWQVLTEEQRETIEVHRQDHPSGGKKNMLDNEAFVRYVDRVCDLDPVQEKALASLKPEDFRKGMDNERFVLLGEKLNLTVKQKQEFTALFEKADERPDKHHDGIGPEDRFKENARLMNAPTFDEKLAHGISTEQADKMVSGYLARRKFHRDILNILTDEQRKQFEEFEDLDLDSKGPFHPGW